MKLTLKKQLLSVLIGFWIFFSFFSVLYNSLKTVSEIRELSLLSENQKLQKLFGASYDFSVFINEHTEKHAKILFYSQTAMPYFYARYYSYPRHLYWLQNEDESIKRTRPKQFDYIALFNMPASFEGYEIKASYSAKQSGIFGSIYKRK